MLYGYELKKLFRHKIIVVLIFICIFANVIFTLLAAGYSGDEYTAEEYRAYWNMISELSMDDAESFLTMRQKQLENSDERWQELQLVKDIYKEVEEGRSYNDYIAGVIEDVQNRLLVSKLFSDSRYSTRNLQHTIQDYEKVSSKELMVQNPKGTLLILQSKVADYLMISMIILIAFFLVIPEKESGQAALAATAAKGRRSLIRAKFNVLLTVTSLLYLIFYIEKILTAGLLYGEIDFTGYIQSVPAYRGCLYDLMIGQFILLDLLLKFIYFALVGSCVFAICMRGKSIIHIIFFMGITVALEIMLYTFVPADGLLAPLKYINIIALMDTDKISGCYISVNLAGYPVRFISVAVITYLVSLIFMYSMFINRWKPGCILWNKKTCVIHVTNGTYTKSHGRYEMLRLRRKSHIIAVLIAVMVIQIIGVNNFVYENEPDKVYYRTYMQYLSGLSQSEQQKYVDEENARYAALLSEKVTAQNRVEHENSLLPYKSWQKVADEYDRICMLRQDGEDVQLTYPYGFEQLMSSGSRFYVISYLMLIVMLMIIFSGIYAIDYEENMNELVSVTYLGKERVMHKRILYSAIIGIVCFIIVYLPEFIIIYDKIGMSNYNVAAASLEFITLFGNLKIWQCMVLFYFIRLCGTAIIIVFISYLSEKLKSTSAALGVAALVLVIPMVFGFMRWMPVINANIII